MLEEHLLRVLRFSQTVFRIPYFRYALFEYSFFDHSLLASSMFGIDSCVVGYHYVSPWENASIVMATTWLVHNHRCGAHRPFVRAFRLQKNESPDFSNLFFASSPSKLPMVEPSMVGNISLL